jgi:hypothetical protein
MILKKNLGEIKYSKNNSKLLDTKLGPLIGLNPKKYARKCAHIYALAVQLEKD